MYYNPTPELLNQVLNLFEIILYFDLNLIKPNQNLYTLTSDIITNLKPILEEYQPEYIHCETTTTMADSLVVFYDGAEL